MLALATTLPVWDARAADPQPPFRTLVVPAGRQDAGGPPPVYGSATIQPGGSVQFLFGVECYDLSGNHVDDTVTLSVSVTPATPALSVSLAPNPVRTFEPPSTVTVSAAAAIVPQVYHLTGVGHGPVCGTYTGWSADVTVECAGGGAVGVAAAGTCPAKCELPTGEGTAFAGWWHDTVGLWEQRLKPAGTSFEGRQVKETDPGGGSDACYFPGSIIKQFNKVTGGTWPVEALNAWGPDHVGRSARAVTYYRTKGRAPCESTIPQQMVINCPTDKLDHKYGPVNTLKYRITGVAVSSVRAGHSKTELYPAPAGAAADAGPATEGPLASPSPAPGAPVRAGEATASDPRPVAKAAEQLERLYRVPITYEDPAYAYPGAIDDVTAAVRRGPAAPGPAGRVLVPRGGTISYTYGAADPEGAGAAARAALGNVLAGYRKLRGLDAFEVLDSGDGYLHVVPTGRLGRAGRPERATALLELPVTIPARERTAAALLDELCARLAEASGREVFVGTVPTGLLLGHATRLGAERERARAVLERLLRETGAPLSWQVLNDPGDGAYAVNVHLVGD